MRESPVAARRRDHYRWLPGQPLLCGDATTAGDALLEREAAARVWQAPRCLVIPASYRRYARLEEARQASAAQGWPVLLRRSAGGLVPQGPGIINLSLARPTRRRRSICICARYCATSCSPSAWPAIFRR